MSDYPYILCDKALSSTSPIRIFVALFGALLGIAFIIFLGFVAVEWDLSGLEFMGFFLVPVAIFFVPKKLLEFLPPAHNLELGFNKDRSRLKLTKKNQKSLEFSNHGLSLLQENETHSVIQLPSGQTIEIENLWATGNFRTEFHLAGGFFKYMIRNRRFWQSRTHFANGSIEIYFIDRLRGEKIEPSR